jgi:hypothetical protein
MERTEFKGTCAIWWIGLPGAAQQSAGFSESRVNHHNQGRLRGDALVEDWKESRRASRMSTFSFCKVHTILVAIRAAQTGVYSF